MDKKINVSLTIKDTISEMKVKKYLEEAKTKGFTDPMQAYFAKGIAGYLRGCIDRGYVKGEDEIEEALRKLLE